MMKRLREDIAPLITAIVVPLIVAITGVLAWNLNRSVAVLDNEIRAREQARLETVGDRDFHFRIYEAVARSRPGPCRPGTGQRDGASAGA